MDLQALSQMNETLTNHLNTMRKNMEEKNNNSAGGMKSKSDSSSIVVARKGDSGYIQNMDADNDGEITLEEFNTYCEENGISEKDKLKILSLMNTSKTNSKVLDKAKKPEKETEEKETAKTEGTIYARRGDDKYNEQMDTDKNNIVTYKEYLDYCNKKAKNSEKDNSNENNATQAYSRNEHFDDDEEISVEVDA